MTYATDWRLQSESAQRLDSRALLCIIKPLLGVVQPLLEIVHPLLEIVHPLLEIVQPLTWLNPMDGLQDHSQ